MALITFQLTDRQFDRLLAERRQEREIEAQRWVSLFTRLDALEELVSRSNADAELAAVAREAKAVIDEAATALNLFTP